MIDSPRNLEKEYKDKQQLQRKVIATLAYFLKIYWSIIKQSSKKKWSRATRFASRKLKGFARAEYSLSLWRLFSLLQALFPNILPARLWKGLMHIQGGNQRSYLDFFVIMTFILTASNHISKSIACTVMERANTYTRRQPEKLPWFLCHYGVFSCCFKRYFRKYCLRGYGKG